MAYSPTPHSSLPRAGRGGSSNPFYRLDTRSPSPPAQQPTVNKRDKRRMLLQDRLAGISSAFAENRDSNYRKQLQQYHADINFINTAQLYDNKPLLEPGESEGDEIATNGVAGMRQQQSGLVNGNTRLDTQPKTGRHAARFTQEVNDTMEQRDVNLVALSNNFNFTIQHYEKDYKFAVEVAEREHLRLLKSLRQQLISNVQQKKATLHREKEKLDIADTNALLHYPNQFNINNTASPGGVQSNRKTRHTRHRQDADDLDTGIYNGTGNGKRKRKGAIDTENGSPGPSGIREAEPITLNGNRDNQTRLEILPVPSPAYTLSRLFSDRELNANLQQAIYEVIQSHSSTSSSSNNKRRKHNPAISTDTLMASTTITTDLTDLEDNISITNPEISNLDGVGDADATTITTLAATAMDRTPSQLYHATRSAGRLQVATDPRTSLGELAGRQAAADLLGTYNHNSRAIEKPKKDGEDSPPSRLTDQQVEDDLRLMEAAIRRMDEAAAKIKADKGEKGDNKLEKLDRGKRRMRGGGELDGDLDENEAEEDAEHEDGGDVLATTTAGVSVLSASGGGGEDGSILDQKVVELALGDEKENYVGPVGFWINGAAGTAGVGNAD